jgi:hypothetical protein
MGYPEMTIRRADVRFPVENQPSSQHSWQGPSCHARAAERSTDSDLNAGDRQCSTNILTQICLKLNTMSEIGSIIAQLERHRKSLDTAIAALRGNDGQGPNSSSAPDQSGLSEGRKRQIEAMRRYWAEKQAASSRKKAARRITPEGRRRLAEAMRKRWAAKRGAAKKATSKR